MSQLPSVYLERAVDQMSQLPGIGRRTALRLVLHLLRRNPDDVMLLAGSLQELVQNVRYCRLCHNISDSDTCSICASNSRDHATICVVETVQDVMAIENTTQYNGVYHVLGGIISPMDGIGPKDIQIDSLLNRIVPEHIKEVILALPTTMEGDTTTFYIFKRLEALLATTGKDITITQLARGVAVGNDLEYTDEITLGKSILNRTKYEGNR